MSASRVWFLYFFKLIYHFFCSYFWNENLIWREKAFTHDPDIRDYTFAPFMRFKLRSLILIRVSMINWCSFLTISSDLIVSIHFMILCSIRNIFGYRLKGAYAVIKIWVITFHSKKYSKDGILKCQSDTGWIIFINTCYNLNYCFPWARLHFASVVSLPKPISNQIWSYIISIVYHNIIFDLFHCQFSESHDRKAILFYTYFVDKGIFIILNAEFVFSDKCLSCDSLNHLSFILWVIICVHLENFSKFSTKANKIVWFLILKRFLIKLIQLNI